VLLAAMWLSVGPRARELYDLPPLLGFFRDALSIFGRREGEHRASKVGEARLHLGGACGRSRPWVSEIAPMVRLMPRPDYKRSRVRREPRAIGSATDKLPSKHPRQYRDGVRHQRKNDLVIRRTTCGRAVFSQGDAARPITASQPPGRACKTSKHYRSRLARPLFFKAVHS
jgi:hypothetical protein